MNNNDSVIKSFGTILIDNRHVNLQASKYKQNQKTTTDLTYPSELNPIKQWANLLQSVKNQGACGCCFAMATAGALGDRLTIMTLAQFAVELSPYQMIMCEDAINTETHDPEYLKEINNLAHSSGACNGNTLYNAMDFMYTCGLTTERCVNEGEFSKYNIKRLEYINTDKGDEVPMCQDVIGKEYDTCLDTETAARFYRICAGYSVDSRPESIKQEIYKWGPVASGFIVYDDFIHSYDGTTIYMGPAEKSQKQGGHAIKIMGWGTENGVDYWWCCNSWGANWGLSGYFKMKIGIPECELEKNVVGFIPDLVGFKNSYILYDIKLDPKDVLLRKTFGVDQATGFRYTAIDKIKKGKLKGNLDQVICKYIPDFEKMIVGEMSPEDVTADYIKLAQYQGDDGSFKLSLSVWKIVFICIGAFLLGVFIKRINRNKKSVRFH
jgi:cathepsin B